MAKSKAVKKVLKEEYLGLFDKAHASIVAEYRGISAVELAELRVGLRKAGASFKVVKNRVAKIALETHESEKLAAELTGPIGLAYMYGDVAAGAKALLEFEKKHEVFKVRGGVMDGRLLSYNDLKSLSELPSKDVLLAKIIGTLISPHRGLVTVLNGVGSKLVRVIGAIKDQKS